MQNVPPDPIEQLMYDHREVDKLFMQLEQAEGEVRREITDAIIGQLTVHGEVEEQAVYPVMREALPDGEERVQEAIAEHQEVKEILGQLESGDPDDPDVQSQVFALMTNVRHHVEEEENELLPKLREALSPGAFTELAENMQAARQTAS